MNSSMIKLTRSSRVCRCRVEDRSNCPECEGTGWEIPPPALPPDDDSDDPLSLDNPTAARDSRTWDRLVAGPTPLPARKPIQQTLSIGADLLL